MIYLDNSATTSIDPEVLDAMLPYFKGEYGNASSAHQIGNRAKVALEEARETLARAINAQPREITFTSSGTEANNTAIKGPLYKKFFSGTPWPEMSILTSPVEHHSVLHPVEFMGKLGVERDYAAVTETGRVLPTAVEQLVNEHTALVSLMFVNNEVGTINPIKEIVTAVRARTNGLIHTDAVQAFGKLPIDVRALDIDLLTLSAHKISGPKGIGALFTKVGVEWEAHQHGGAQERNRRGGTESVALAVGFAKAAELAIARMHSDDHLNSLHDHLISKLRAIPKVVFNSATDGTSVNSIVDFSFTPEVLSKLDPDALMIRFDLEGIAVSNGSACTSGSQQPSHVLMAIGKGNEIASKSVRVSMSYQTTIEELDRFIEVLKRIIHV